MKLTVNSALNKTFYWKTMKFYLAECRMKISHVFTCEYNVNTETSLTYCILCDYCWILDRRFNIRDSSPFLFS